MIFCYDLKEIEFFRAIQFRLIDIYIYKYIFEDLIVYVNVDENWNKEINDTNRFLLLPSANLIYDI